MRQASIWARAPSTTIRILTTVAALAGLAGCQAANNAGGDATRGASLGTSVQLIERDVEAPEDFQTTELALWDGRPSLGGVWVASPDVTEPERVIMRNEENGKFVIGALFKRERLGPGPALQLSSDAAAALGALAGSPVTLDVVALRRESAPEPAATPEPVAAPDARPAEAPPAAAAAAPSQTDELLMLAARAMARKRAAEAAAAAPQAARDGAGAPDVTATSLDAPAETAASLDRPGPRRGLAGLFGGRREVAPVPAAPHVAASTVPEQDFVQVGLFSDESNARKAAGRLSGAGVVPSIRPQGKFWRVVVGPAPTEADRVEVLRIARELGFDDAYALTI